MDKSFLYDRHAYELGKLRGSNYSPEALKSITKMVTAGIPFSYIDKIVKSGKPYNRKYLEYDLFEDNFDAEFKNGRPVAKKDFYLEKVEDYLINFKSQVAPQGFSFMFTGGNGTGKTYLSTYILAYLIERHDLDGYYISSRELYNAYNQGMFNGEGEQRQLFQYCKYCDLLVIDEFGKETDSDSFREVFESLLRDRVYNGRPVILGTNLDFIPKKGANLLITLFGNSIMSVMSEKFRVVCFKSDVQFRKKVRVSWPGGE